MIRPHYWELFSKKARAIAEKQRYVGSFTEASPGLRLVLGREMSASNIKVCFYWLVDETDGVIADVKYHAYGPMGLIIAAEAACELLIRKNYEQASRLSADIIDRHLRDKAQNQALPKECHGHLNMILSAIDRAAEQCIEIPVATDFAETPIEAEFGAGDGGIANWHEISPSEQRRIIEEVMDKEIRPYVELDAGGVKVEGFTGKQVLISYQGSCTSCHSSTGSTLSAIQQILRSRIHPELQVIPQL